MVGHLLALEAKYTISVAAAVGDQERIEQLLQKDPGQARRLDSVGESPLSYASAGGYLHIVRLLLEYGADPNSAENGAPDGLALYLACAGNHLEVARLLLEHGANPNAGLDGCMHCVNITRVYHGEQAKPLEQLMRRHGAYTQPYHMSAGQMKRAIRDGHEVTRHPEFLGNLMAKRNAELLDLYLDSDPTALDRMADELACPWSAALLRKLLARGLDPSRPDWLGKTFLHACAATGDRSIAAVLLGAGADVNAREIEFQGTPLAWVVRLCCAAKDPMRAERGAQMVEFLLQRGAATNLPDDEPWATPKAWARKLGLADIEEILLEHGATA
jgi:ankyrin repeat protein